MSRIITVPFVAVLAVMVLAACGDDGAITKFDKGVTSDAGTDGTSPWPDLNGRYDGAPTYDGPGSDGQVPRDNGVSPKDGSSKDSYAPPPAKCGGTAKVYLAEVSTGQPDYLALINKGTAATSIVGFKLEMMGINLETYTFLAGASIPAGGTAYVFEYTAGTTAGDINTSDNIPFYDDLDSNSVALYDASGNLLDFVPIGDKAVSVPPTVTAGLVAWPTSYDSSKQSFQRAAFTGKCPTFKASDWTAKTMTRP